MRMLKQCVPGLSSGGRGLGTRLEVSAACCLGSTTLEFSAIHR